MQNFTLKKLAVEMVSRETGFHGRSWDRMHGGYFGDPRLAAPLIKRVKAVMDKTRPDVVVDLAGGTGFVLHELIKRHPDPGVHFANVDLSRRQLKAHPDAHVTAHVVSLQDVRRSQIDRPSKRFLFMMRSALHYAGRQGLAPLLRHLRRQMRVGEFFVHQTACFESSREVQCINALYRGMNVEKWYPTTRQLRGLLERHGWEVRAIVPAPTLDLTSDELLQRYGLDDEAVEKIRTSLSRRFGASNPVFRARRKGFRGRLPYRILECVAK
ncbi:MAG: class I SAM-dependent methyltransferase [Verrucomicrobiae bacterium]|nr:class I SAM-dependent methyltransferase [Verrucomicrobiae bacterium]